MTRKKEPPFESISSFIRNRRLTKKLTELDVAKKLSYSSAGVIKSFEECITPLSKEDLIKLMEILDISEEDFINTLIVDIKAYVRYELLKGKDPSQRLHLQMKDHAHRDEEHGPTKV